MSLNKVDCMGIFLRNIHLDGSDQARANTTSLHFYSARWCSTRDQGTAHAACPRVDIIIDDAGNRCCTYLTPAESCRI